MCKFRDKYVKSLQYVLYDTLLPLNDRDRFDLIKDTVINGTLTEGEQNIYKMTGLYIENSYQDGKKNYKPVMEFITFVQNDKSQLLKLLNFIDTKNNKTFIYNIRHHKNAIQLIFYNPIISDYDKYKLLSNNTNEATSLMTTFCWERDNSASNIIKSFKNIDLLIKLLKQKTKDPKNDDVKETILYCRDKEDIDTIFAALNYNKTKINQLLQPHKVDDFHCFVREYILEWKEYIKLKEILFNENTKDINVDFNEYKTDPLITLCKYGEIEIVKKLIHNVKYNKEQKLYNQTVQTAIEKIFCNDKDFKNKKEIFSVLLNVCEKDKMKFLLAVNSKHMHKKSVYYSATKEWKMTILHHFDNKKNKKYLLEVLKENTDEDYNYLYLSTLNDEEKIKLIYSHVQKLSIYNARYRNWFLEILNFMQNDKNAFKTFISNKLNEITDALLSQITITRNQNDLQTALKLIAHLMKQKTEWVKALKWSKKSKTLLMAACECPYDNVLKTILNSINKMDYKLQLDILKIKASYEGNFLYNIKREQDMKYVLSILNDNIIKQLVSDLSGSQTSNKDTIQNKLRYGWNTSDDTYLIEMLISSFVDYLKFDELLLSKKENEIDLSFHKYYLTNPFMTICLFGKYKTMNKLLNYFGNNTEQLSILLLNNFNLLNGNNCLMELAAHNGESNCEHGIIMNILNHNYYVQRINIQG
eukprot:184222_1